MITRKSTLAILIILLLALLPALCLAEGYNTTPASGGGWTDDGTTVSTPRAVAMSTTRLTQYTVATLPATPTTGDRAEIIDGASPTDCVAGGGTDIVTCRYNGAAWANAGDGQAAGSAEVQNEAFSAANFNGDLDSAPTQDIFYDYMHLLDTDDDGVITDSELSIAGLTLTGANGLRLGVAGTTMGLLRLYSNVEGNNFYFDLFGGANFTENVGLRVPPSMPPVANALMNADVTTGNMGWTDPADFLASAGTDNIKDTHIDWGAGAGQIGSTDIIALFGSGSCSGYLKSDGTCDTPSGAAHDAVTINAGIGAIALTGANQVLTAHATIEALVDNSALSPTWSNINPTFGTVTAANYASSAADGAHYIEAANTVALSSTATLGRLGYYDGEWRFANGTNWTTDYLLRKTAMDTPAELEALIGGGAFMSDLLGYATAGAVRTGLGLDSAANLETNLSLGAFASDLLGYATAAAVRTGIGLYTSDHETTGYLGGRTKAVSIGNCEGAHDGTGNAATLTDSGESLTVDAYIGMQLYNITDGSSCTITDNDATTITCALAGGSENDWDAADVWQVGPGPAQSGSAFYISTATTIAHPATAGYVAGYFAAAAVVVKIDPYSASMTINFSDDGVYTDPGAGDEIDGDGTQGDFIWIHNASTTEAYSQGVNGSWADGGAS